MYETINYFCDLFKIVFQTSVTASILIGLILIIRKLIKGRLGIRFQYSLWFLIILRLVISKLRESTFSIFTLISQMNKSIFSLFSMKEITLSNILEYSGNKISGIYNQDVVLGSINSIINNKSEVRRRIIMIKLFNKKAYKFSAIAIAALLIVGGVCLTDAKALIFNKSKAINIDKVDFPFVTDPKIVGKWQSVDFVEKIEDFKVDTSNFKGSLPVKELSFTSDGEIPQTIFTWTKDHILNPVDNTDSNYQIKDMAGSTYMFLQWKSGDYTIRGMKPQYYVLKKFSSTPSITTSMSGQEVKVRVDKIDYPFVNDSEVIGKWKSIDFVEKIQDFKPKVQLWKGDLYLDNLTFKEKGKLDNKNLTWTKDLVINAKFKTASKYTIKEIDGLKYMFFEWKSGDYTQRGATPWYYVLKQVK